MNISRREFSIAGALALGATVLPLSRSAEANLEGEALVAEAVETLRKGSLEADKVKLDRVTSAQLSYGHSDGRVETKEQFITAVMNRKAVVKSLAFPDLKIAVVGDAAVARHIWLSESELDGKATSTRIGVLEVWQKQDGAWKLLARQGFRLPA